MFYLLLTHQFKYLPHITAAAASLIMLSHVGATGGGSLTSGRRQDHIGVLGRSGDLGDPSTVPLQGPPHCHLLGHFGEVRWCLLQGWIRIFQRSGKT